MASVLTAKLGSFYSILVLSVLHLANGIPEYGYYDYRTDGVHILEDRLHLASLEEPFHHVQKRENEAVAVTVHKLKPSIKDNRTKNTTTIDDTRSNATINKTVSVTTTESPLPSVTTTPEPQQTTTTTTTAPTDVDTTTVPAEEELEPAEVEGVDVSNYNRTEDHHKYYNSSFIESPSQGERYWVDLDSFPSELVVIHEMLSQSHRRAARVVLSFDFPFYGHIVRNITIATGGFIFTGEYVHAWLAATQYIAPLMANFDTTLSNQSAIKYADNGTAFIVQWTNVSLKDNNWTSFTFQATLLDSGNIVFAYRQIPVEISTIKMDSHPVKVGMSDAYIIDRTIFFVRRKTIYEYHRVSLKNHNITNGTAIYFTALPTCVSLSDCKSCLGANIGFKCGWCSEAGRCSDGRDRHRQQWITKGCNKLYIMDGDKCPAATLAPLTPTTETTATVDNTVTEPHIAAASPRSHLSTGGVIGIVVLLSLVVVITLWLLYAYRYPHTSSGQLLIRYRPSQWRMRRGEARYTAASIHM